jgi:UDP-glucuronate decarboxylase
MGSSDDVTGPLNLGNPTECTMLELAQLIIDLTGSRSKICFRPLPIDDPRQRQPDITTRAQIQGGGENVAAQLAI